jgi:hypothetical protein
MCCGIRCQSEMPCDLLDRVSMIFPGDLDYQNQVGGADAGQPDVVGLDHRGQQR